jgi:glycosyltransferase involved in cell wall biosynthesis
MSDEKGVPAIVEAFEELDRNLMFAGARDKIDSDVLRRVEAAENLDYRGFVGEAEKRELLARCRGVVFNGVKEDFGIVPVEANACGKA